MSTVKERVEKGAALLDEHAPGWHREISLTELNLASCENCVCGQVAYAAARGNLKLRGFSRFLGNTPFHKMCRFLGTRLGVGSFGFIPEEYGFDSYGNTTYSRLDREWKRLIKARLREEAKS